MKKQLLLISMIATLGSSPAARAGLLVYEPFNYPVGALTGKTGGMGFAAAWAAGSANNAGRVWNETTNVAWDGNTLNWNGALTNGFPALPLSGSRYVGADNTTSGSNLDISRTLSSSAGAMAGGDGTLWMSAVYHLENTGFGAGMTIGLGSGTITNRGRTFPVASTSYIGINGSTSASTANGRLNAMVTANGWTAGQFALTAGTVALPTPSTKDLIVILKFTFGASDTVEAAFFSEDTSLADITEANFNASPNKVTATYAGGIDENGLNVLTITQGRSNNAMDEIRIGDNFADVISLPSPGAVDIATSTVTASPGNVPADGTTTSTITVTLTDSIGVPVPGKDIALAGSPGNSVISPAGPVTTNSSGQAVFTVKANSSGTEVYTATNTTDSLTITQTATVNFISSADSALSTVAAVPSYVNADGAMTSTITVSLKAAGDLPVPGKSVTLAQTLGSGATITPATAQTSDANGQVVFTVSSTTPGAAEFTASDTTDSVVVTQKGTVQFVGLGDAGTSTVLASNPAVAANGTSSTTITVTLKDAAGFPVQNKNISLANTSGPQAAVISSPSATTNVNGQAVFTVSSSTIGTEVFTATDTTDSVVITQTASVTFVDPAMPLSYNVNFVQFTPGLGNFEDPATLSGPAGGSGETWNQFRAASGSNLLASNGTATAVGVTTNFSECRQRSNGTLTLLKHGLTDFAKGLSTTVTINGLPPGSLYNVWLASTADFGSASENANGTFSTSNSTSNPGGQSIDQSVTANTTTWQRGNNYALLENVVVDGSGQIVITAASTPDRRLPLNGFQLTPASRALITAFGIPGSDGVIDQNAKTISLTVPYGTNLTTLAPTFTLNSGTCNQTSGSPPSPTFAAANPVHYIVTDTSTDPDTVNDYTVTVTVTPQIGTLVIDLGTSPAGTFIQGGQYIGSGPTNLPLPALPTGSILRSIAVNTKLEASGTGNNFASDLAVLLDPTPGTPGGDFSVGITNGTEKFGAALQLGWPASADNGVGTSLVSTKTGTDWTAAGTIDLATTGLFLGNGYGSPPDGATWSGTITLTYDVVSSNTAPTISDIADLSVPSGGNTGALAFTVGDAETDAGSLSVTGSSSNTTLVPNDNIVFGGSGAARTVTVTPVSGLSGSATITVTVTDAGSLTAQDTFVLTVTDNYLSWAAANGVTGGPNGDSDNDGVKNLVEYALVNGGERGTLSGNTITFTKRGAPYGNDLTYDIESSTDLVSWGVLAKPPVIESSSEIKYTFTPGSPVKNFARLKVVRTTP